MIIFEPPISVFPPPRRTGIGQERYGADRALCRAFSGGPEEGVAEVVRRLPVGAAVRGWPPSRYGYRRRRTRALPPPPALSQGLRPGGGGPRRDGRGRNRIGPGRGDAPAGDRGPGGAGRPRRGA